MKKAARNFLQLSVLLFCIFSIAGCGFHLRQSLDIPISLQPLKVVGSGSGYPIGRYIKQKNKIDNKAAKYLLEINTPVSTKRSLSIGSGSIALEYQLLESISYRLLDPSGKQLQAVRTVKEQRVFQNNPEQILSSNEEEQRLRQEMTISLGDTIIRQLQSYAEQQKLSQQQP